MIKKYISVTLLGCGLLFAKSYFVQQPDICDKSFSQKCTNDYTVVKNLQRVLNRDKKLHLHIKEDGKWGEETKKAVVAFQKAHGIEPADGWVGPKTKRQLDRYAQYVKLSREKAEKRVALMSKAQSGGYATYNEFRRKINPRKSYAVFMNKALLRKANGRNTKLIVDVSEQRIKMYVGGKVALDSPCTTGARRKLEPNTKRIRDKHTPLGTYRIMEKIADKRSTIFGDFYKNGRHIYHGDRRMYRGPRRGVKFVGHTLEYWMRLTSSGIGLHASKYVKRYPATNGCIRLPKHVARTIFRHVRKGTKVKVIN